MKKQLYGWSAKLTGKNFHSTPKETIIDQMNEPRPLPMGRKEFDEWSDRIISGALLPPSKEDSAILLETQKFALASMIMHLGPTESHKPDAFFIHSLRKGAINQVAHAVSKELHEAAKARTQADESERAAKAAFDETNKR